jgi:hypothetical protein
MTKKVELYRFNDTTIEAGFLDNSLLGKYEESLEGFSEKAKDTLGNFFGLAGDLAGSNPFMMVHLKNLGLLEDSILLSTFEIMKIISKDKDFGFNTYADLGLALRSARDPFSPNDSLARSLHLQLSKRRIPLGDGVLIPFDALTIEEDPSSYYGLTFNISDGDLEPTEVCIKDLNDYSWDCSRPEGLSRVIFGKCQDLSSGSWGLSPSTRYGRVITLKTKSLKKKKRFFRGKKDKVE